MKYKKLKNLFLGGIALAFLYAMLIIDLGNSVDKKYFSIFPHLLLFSIFIPFISYFITYSHCKNLKQEKYVTYKKRRDDELKKIYEKYNVIYHALTLDGKGIIITENENRVLIYNGFDKEPLICKYEDILSFDLIENNNSAIQGKGLETYLAGQLLGGIGAIAVASSERNIKTKCNDLHIEITTNGISSKNGRIDLISNTSIRTNQAVYKELYDFAKDIVVTLDKVMLETSKQIKSENKNTTEDEDDVYTKLDKLKELKDKGTITKEEFNKKKKELLDKI